MFLSTDPRRTRAESRRGHLTEKEREGDVSSGSDVPAGVSEARHDPSHKHNITHSRERHTPIIQFVMTSPHNTFM